MQGTLRILLLEDMAEDRELIQAELERAGLDFSLRQVSDQAGFIQALKEFTPDVILTDYALPRFDALTALRVAAELAPTVPCIIVTGSINEETAVGCMKAGAADYVLKQFLARLGPAIKSALEKGRAESALRESQMRKAAILESALDAIVTIDHEGKIVEFNPAAEETFGYSRSEAMGKVMADLIIPPVMRAAHRHGMAHYLATGEGPLLNRRIEITAMRAGGTFFPVELAITRIKLPGPPLFTAHVRDITERKRAEAATTAALKEKEVMLKEINHRVKNNLQVISSLLYLQSEQIRDPALRAQFQESESRVRSMALIHESLYQSKNLSKVNFGRYVRQLAADLARSFGASPDIIRFAINVPEIHLAVDTAIPCGLIINELVSNALKYAFPGSRRGEIGIDLVPSGEGNLTLTVRDNGIGFPAGQDFRNTTSLGMQLVVNLTAQLQANIEVRNHRGTEVTITFPHTSADERPA
jgi:PAS domain S-box-containing protein